MKRRSNSPDVARRNFLKGASLAGAALAAPTAANAICRHEGGSPGPDPDRGGNLAAGA